MTIAETPFKVKVISVATMVAVCVVAMLTVSSIAIALASYVKNEDTIKDMKAQINELINATHSRQVTGSVQGEDSIEDLKDQINELTLELNTAQSHLAEILLVGVNGTLGIQGEDNVLALLNICTDTGPTLSMCRDANLVKPF